MSRPWRLCPAQAGLCLPDPGAVPGRRRPLSRRPFRRSLCTGARGSGFHLAAPPGAVARLKPIAVFRHLPVARGLWARQRPAAWMYCRTPQPLRRARNTMSTGPTCDAAGWPWAPRRGMAMARWPLIPEHLVQLDPPAPLAVRVAVPAVRGSPLPRKVATRRRGAAKG